MTSRPSGALSTAPSAAPAERYQILGTIGTGASATVYKARDLELDVIVALKVLAPCLAGDPRVIDRLKREIRTARRVRHPNVARVYDLASWDGRLCIAMEHIQGVTLAERLKQGPLAWRDVAALLSTLALTLESAHELGVVHRDLKPANVILDERGNAYVLDFGIALGPDTNDTNSLDIVRGTPAYMAPERWRGLPGSPASDLYSLGVLGYEALSGQVPFRAMSLRLLRSQHLHAPLAPLTVAAPPELVALVSQLLAKRPEQRPASAASVARQLRRILPPREPGRALPGSRGRILVIDDEPSVRHLLAELLRKRGATVLEAEDGPSGIKAAREHGPDLVLLDISMPGLDGVTTLARLRELPALAGRPIVMLTASSDPTHPELSRAMGAAAFLNKPANPDVLDLLLDKYLS